MVTTNTVQLQNLKTGKVMTVLTYHRQVACSQVITGSHDKTVRLWDLRKGKAMTTLTYHKKSVRGLALHPTEYCFASASAENIKKFRLPRVSLPWHSLHCICSRLIFAPPSVCCLSLHHAVSLIPVLSACT